MNNNIKKNKNGFNKNIYEFKDTKNDFININNDKSILKNNMLTEAVVDLSVQLGLIKIKIKDLLKIKSGTMFSLKECNYDMLNIFLNKVLIAKGELVRLKDKYGVRITKIIKSTY